MAEQTLSVQQINIVVKPIDPKSRGGLPRYRQLLAAKRALMSFDEAEPEDIDEIYRLLSEHMTEPSNPTEKQKILELISMDELTEIFNVIMGGTIVPPVKDAA